MISKNLLIKISKLRRILDLGFITFYLSVQDELNLPPDNWQPFRELQQNLINGLVYARTNDYPAFFRTVRKLQKLYSENFENNKNIPLCLNEFFIFEKGKYELLNINILHRY